MAGFSRLRRENSGEMTLLPLPLCSSSIPFSFFCFLSAPPAPAVAGGCASDVRASGGLLRPRALRAQRWTSWPRCSRRPPTPSRKGQPPPSATRRSRSSPRCRSQSSACTASWRRTRRSSPHCGGPMPHPGRSWRCSWSASQSRRSGRPWSCSTTSALSHNQSVVARARAHDGVGPQPRQGG